MADRPIIFSAPMVLALLAGRKTQTRRLLRIRGHKSFSEFGPSDTRGYDWHFRDAEKRWHDLRHAELLARLPWVAGDRLWVREGWAPNPRGVMAHGAIYRAGHEEAPGSGPRVDLRWRPSIHMPRWASRLTLTVTDVRVQPIHDMLLNDYEAEGVVDRTMSTDEAVAVFSQLWNHLHGPGAWEANPEIVALSFTVERKNIDA